MSDKMVTHCKGCIFVKQENKDSEQQGCSLGRVKTLDNIGIQDNYYLLNRFCNTYRPQEWMDELPFEEQLNINDAVLEEVYPRMGYFVRLKTCTTDPIQELTTTLESIVAASYKREGKPMFVVIINDKVEYNEDIWTLCLRLFGQMQGTDYHIVQINQPFEKDVYLMDEAFTHAQNAWIHTTTSGQVVPNDINDKLHNLINIDLKQISAVTPYNEFDGFIFPAYLFKFLNGNKTKIYQDAIMDHGTFLEKLITAQERSKTKTLYSWEEFNAS